MHRIDGAGHVDNAWVPEDLATNRPPTEITHDFMNALQEEVANVIEVVEPLNKADNTQLLQAISAMIAAAMVVVSDATTAVKGILKLADDAGTQAGEDAATAVTPASARSNTATPASDPTYADNSAKWASTSWMRGAMGAIATAAGFSYSFTANGYFKFPSWMANFILQWGLNSNLAANTTAIVTLPIAFQTSGLFSIATICSLTTNTAVTQNASTGADLLSSSQIQVRNGLNAIQSLRWFAGGR